MLLPLSAAAAATHTRKVKKKGVGVGVGGACSCSRHCSPTLVCVHSRPHPLTFAAIARICWGGHHCHGSSLVCVLILIHLCPLGCLPVQLPCGLRSHSFVLTHPIYSCLFLLHLAFIHACSFMCLSPFVCASPRVCTLVPVFVWALFVLICICSCLCLAFAWARSCPPASCLCLYQIHN